MGTARKAGGGPGRWVRFFAQRDRVVNERGVTVPGISTRPYQKRKSGSNKSGALRKANSEWSAKDRKQEDHQRGINRRAVSQHVAEGLADYDDAVEDRYADLARLLAWEDDHDWHYRDDDEDLEAAIAGTGVLLNGEEVHEDWPECYCTYCGQSSTVGVLTERVSHLESKIALALKWLHANKDLRTIPTIIAILEES